MEPKYIRTAIDQLKQAQIALVMSARALQMSGLSCETTLKEIKENIGDLSLTIEILNDQL